MKWAKLAKEMGIPKRRASALYHASLSGSSILVESDREAEFVVKMQLAASPRRSCRLPLDTFNRSTI